MFDQQQTILAFVLAVYGMRIEDFSVGYGGRLLRGPINIFSRAWRASLNPTVFALPQADAGELEELGREHSWFAYFHGDDDGNLPHWLVIDLEVFRRNQKLGGQRLGRSMNGGWIHYDVRDFSVGILIAASDSLLAPQSDDAPATLSPLYAFAVGRRQRGEWQP